MSDQQTIVDRPWLYYSSSSETEKEQDITVPAPPTQQPTQQQKQEEKQKTAKRQRLALLLESSSSEEDDDIKPKNKKTVLPAAVVLQKEQQQKPEEMPRFPLSTRLSSPVISSDDDEEQDDDDDESTQEPEPEWQTVAHDKRKYQFSVNDKVRIELTLGRVLFGIIVKLNMQNKKALVEYKLRGATAPTAQWFPFRVIEREVTLPQRMPERRIVQSKSESKSKTPLYIGKGTPQQPIELLSDLDEESPDVGKH